MLRGRGLFKEAIDTMEDNLADMHKDCLLNAYIEILYAAEEGGYRSKIGEYLPKLAILEPDLPIVVRLQQKN
jgi:hypothetical protein